MAAVAIGACLVERHITMSRAMWGSDQAASLEPNGITRLIRDIRLIETSLGNGVKRVLDVGKTDYQEAAPRHGRKEECPTNVVQGNRQRSRAA